MSPITTKKFPSECNPRGVVKTADKVLIWNSDTGASDEYSTVAELTKIQDDAILLKAAKAQQVISGGGLTGGGDLSSNRTLAVVSANDGITVNADNIELVAVNALDSTSTTKPLAAAQGKALNDGKVDKVTGERLISAAEITKLSNTSNTNTGDETQATIKTKLGAATASVDGYLTKEDFGTFNGKQAALGYTPENVANKKSTITNSETDYPNGKAVYDALALKLDKTAVKTVEGISATDVVSQKFVTDEFAKTNFVFPVGKNLFNKDALAFRTGGYYSGFVWISNASYMLTPLISVEALTYYCLSPHPSAIYDYIHCFDEAGVLIGIVTNKTSTTGVNGTVTFRTIANTKYIAITLTISLYNTYKSQIQVEDGQVKTAYEAFSGITKIKAYNIEGNEEIVKIPTIEQDVADIKLFVDTDVRGDFPAEPQYGDLLIAKCPNFFNAMKKKNKDVCVVLTGTSLTQGNLYSTTRDNASERPPLLHTYDLAGLVFDKLITNWYGQKYRMYDHLDLSYSESTWEVTNDCKVSNVSIWDDKTSNKNGLIKTTLSQNASVGITVPLDAWQFNFIYRTDSQGGNCIVSITEGNGKMEVYNGSSWVEANGHTFSMLESAATDTKGNTCYQKRLKMRCKNKGAGGINSIGTTKAITISKGADGSRFNVVGFEWSPREFMFTLINGARGSHQWGVEPSYNLEHYQDLDIWEFNPDLIMSEVTVINWGASTAAFGLITDPLYFVNAAKRAYFNEFSDDSRSLYEKSNHWQDCEVIFYGDTLAIDNACWDVDGNPVFGIVGSAATNGSVVSQENVGRIKTNFENYEAVDEYMKSKTDYIFIPVTMIFKNVVEKYYGSYKTGFLATGKNGASLSIDTTHLNDNGASLWALLINPLFNIF